MKLKKRHFTLIEMMIVLTIIIMLMGVLAYNMGGSLEEAKAKTTQINIEKLDGILNIAIAENPSLINDIDTNWEQIVRSSPMVKKADDVIYDGWGYKYRVALENGTIIIHSDKYDTYRKTKAEKLGK